MACPVAMIAIFLCGIAASVSAELDRDAKAEKRFKQLLIRLRGGHDREAEESLLTMMKRSELRRIPKNLGATLYHTALDNLAMHPSSLEAKDFVVQIGRWHLARSKGIKKATDHDLRQDIFARCRGR